MPELPEVETVCRGIARGLQGAPKIATVELRRRDLRVPVAKNLPRLLTGETIQAVRRRAKFLLFDTEKYTLISHLGMSGSWRFAGAGDERKHDHCYITFASGQRLAFHDPRRFGLLECQPRAQENRSRWLKSLGVEPLSADLTATYLATRAKGKKSAVKNFIMDQKVVVGVGNIYASEALFRARVRPTRGVHRLRAIEWENVVAGIQSILNYAIERGGTTLNDYIQASGEEGGFYKELAVYDRAAQPCRQCAALIRTKVLAGRSTYWCHTCQQ